jgi:DNA-binding transcriptional MerR regulator
MAAKRNVAPPRVYSNEDLDQVARDLIARASGLSSSDFKKLLQGDLKKSDKLVIAAALRLTARRECYRWVQAKKMRFFAQDPFDTLAITVRTALAAEPLTENALKARVEASHRGFGDLLKEWLKGCLSRGELFLHPPSKGSKLKRYGREPDVQGLLKKVFSELDKVLVSKGGQKVQRSQILQSLTQVLGISEDKTSPNRLAARERFLVALFRLGFEGTTGGLLSVRELRARLDFDKITFDELALELFRDELITLHYHDYPASLSSIERDELIAGANGQFYVGIALRRG